MFIQLPTLNNEKTKIKLLNTLFHNETIEKKYNLCVEYFFFLRMWDEKI